MRRQPEKPQSRPPALHRLLYSLIAGLLLGIAALAVAIALDRLPDRDGIPIDIAQDQALIDYDGAIPVDPPIAVPDIALTNIDNERQSLMSLRGRPVLLTFGFTHCPDICPLTLNDFQRIQTQLGDQSADIHFVFVSVDGPRDTPAALRHYFSFRGLHNIIALTGAEDDVRALGAPFGLAFEVSQESTPGPYLINHTAGAFLLDADGRWIMRYHFGVPPTTIAADLRRLLQI